MFSLILKSQRRDLDVGAGTFDAPVSAVKWQKRRGYWSSRNRSTVDNVSHILFLEDEFGSSMGAVQLPTSPVSGSIEITETTTHLRIYQILRVRAQAPSGGLTPVIRMVSLSTTSNEGGNPKGLLINGEKSCLASV
jgi:hypothetical protein